MRYCFFFFFQAEDGIRDYKVTGVQTCALPICHIAAGLGVLFSVLPRAAAFAESAMIGVFTILVWGPAIAAAPKARLPWTAFFISWAIASSAWVVAQNISTKEPANEKLATRKVAAV